jgi:hypothetical protein
VPVHIWIALLVVTALPCDPNGESNFDLETVANRSTEAHFNWYATTVLTSTDDAWERMGSLLIPAAEHLEPTPIARAEWIKFFAMLDEPAAASSFRTVR